MGIDIKKNKKYKITKATHKLTEGDTSYYDKIKKIHATCFYVAAF